MKIETFPNMSELSRDYTSHGQTVTIYIYEALEGWSLEIVDKNNNSTRWHNPFKTDEIALKVAIEMIKEKGIDSFIGEPTCLDEIVIF